MTRTFSLPSRKPKTKSAVYLRGEGGLVHVKRIKINRFKGTHLGTSEPVACIEELSLQGKQTANDL